MTYKNVFVFCTPYSNNKQKECFALSFKKEAIKIIENKLSESLLINLEEKTLSVISAMIAKICNAEVRHDNDEPDFVYDNDSNDFLPVKNPFEHVYNILLSDDKINDYYNNVLKLFDSVCGKENMSIIEPWTMQEDNSEYTKEDVNKILTLIEE